MTGTVIGWHLGDVGPRLAAAIGWRYLAAPSPTGTVARPRGPVALVGYSLGCSGLRETLRGEVLFPDLIVTIDGTHSLKAKGAPVHPAHRAVWSAVAERARRDEVTWIATTLGNHRYTERLPGADAYASTGRVLEAALGLVDGALRAPIAINEGSLHVRSYPSAEMDAPAHGHQVRVVLPELWAELVVPGLQVAPADAVTVDPGPPLERLGLRALAVAREHLAQGVREVPGAGIDPQVSAYLQPCRRGGTSAAGILDLTGGPLGLRDDEVAWCAAFASWCTAIADPGLDPDEVAHGYRAAVAELVADAKTRGRWRGPGERPELGWLAIWNRAGGDPLRGGTGHVGRVSLLGPDFFRTIEGNHGNQVAEVTHSLSEPALRGWIAT
jgi:hypothetical protein